MKFTEKEAPVFLTLALAVGLFLGTTLTEKRTQQLMPRQTDVPVSKLDYVRALVDAYYFEKKDADSLTDEMVTAMLQTLDPHSSYVSARDVQQYNSVLIGEFEGIGVTFNILHDTITVISVTPAGPSQKVGILPGDRIVRIDDSTVAGVKIQNTEVIGKLRGKKGSRVKVHVQRHGCEKLLPFEIVRDKIPLHSVEVAYMLDRQTGYIQIQSFSATTGDEFSAALQKLLKQGMQRLVLDLRGNSGGALQAAIAVCDELLGSRRVIVSTRGKSMGKQVFRATSLGSFQDEDQPLVVLIDEWSASASEIVAGAVQDQDRGLIIGRRSFGKGLVQRSFTLYDSSEVLLTVARYYTPTGRCIQKPFENYEEDLIDRYLRGEMNSPDSIKVIDSLKFKTPKGKTVYGGGGIVPDIFIPIDTSGDYVYFNRISREGILFQYAVEYTDKHRRELLAYEDVAAFDKAFTVSDAMVREMMARGEGKNISPKGATPGAKRELKKWCKAYIARNLFGEEGFVYLNNKDDKMLKKAMQILQKK